MKTIYIFTIVIFTFLISCTKNNVTTPEVAVPVVETNTVTTTVVTYSNSINNIISTYCTISCHTQGKNGFAAANLIDYLGVKKEVDTGTFKNRVLIKKNMPPNGSLSSSDLQKLEEWINNGAIE